MDVIPEAWIRQEQMNMRDYHMEYCDLIEIFYTIDWEVERRKAYALYMWIANCWDAWISIFYESGYKNIHMESPFRKTKVPRKDFNWRALQAFSLIVKMWLMKLGWENPVFIGANKVTALNESMFLLKHKKMTSSEIFIKYILWNIIS